LRAVIPGNHQGSRQLIWPLDLSQCAFCNYLTRPWKTFGDKKPSKQELTGKKLRKGRVAIDEKDLDCSAHADDGKSSSLGGAW
jgi:hypothetical protein